jgi:hypothetical protein
MSLSPQVACITRNIMALHMTAIEMKPRSDETGGNPSTTAMTITEMQQIIIQ